jgi:hypothetical protein
VEWENLLVSATSHFLWHFLSRIDLLNRRVLFYTKSVISTRRAQFHMQRVIYSSRTRVISTCIVWFWLVWAWFYTQSVVSTHTRIILTRMRVNMTLASVITVRSSVVCTRRAQFPYAACDFFPQGVFATRSETLRHTNVFSTLTTVISKRTKEWFLPAECDFDSYECDYETHECD